MSEERTRPTTNQPLNADRPRSAFGPAVGVICLLVVIAAVFFVIDYLRYTT